MAARTVERNEISITPFVGVMLVLLIVFMVAAPLRVRSLHTPLGMGDGEAAPPAVFVSLQEDGTIWVGRASVGERAGNWSTLPALLNAHSRGDRRIAVYLRADPKVGYADVVRLFDEIHAAGYADVRVISEDIID